MRTRTSDCPTVAGGCAALLLAKYTTIHTARATRSHPKLWPGDTSSLILSSLPPTAPQSFSSIHLTIYLAADRWWKKEATLSNPMPRYGMQSRHVTMSCCSQRDGLHRSLTARASRMSFPPSGSLESRVCPSKLTGSAGPVGSYGIPFFASDVGGRCSDYIRRQGHCIQSPWYLWTYIDIF